MKKESNIFKLKCNICGKEIGYLISKNPIPYDTKEEISHIKETFNEYKVFCKNCYKELWRKP